MKENTQVREALSALWRLAKPGPMNLLAAPEFIHLKHACMAAYPNIGKSGAAFALSNALRSLGLPCLLPSGHSASSVEAAASLLDDAFRAKECRRVHLAPMNLASDLPPIAFGAARICRLNADELGSVMGASRLERWFPSDRIDFDRLADFQWLVVEDRVPLSDDAEERAVPGLFFNLQEDFGRIEPHKERLPTAVLQAIFFLLLAPWEDLVEYQEADWRAFQIPWSHTFDEDLFARPQNPPSPDTLTWVEHFDDDGAGGISEDLRPLRLPLRDGSEHVADRLDQHRWSVVQRALSSPMFETPVVHFFVRAFLADGIDEFLAHITTIEAALGLRSDYRPTQHRTIGATRRVAHRLSVLLCDETAGQSYIDLFDIRSAFLHGRNLGAVSTKMRVLARSLARRVIDGLIESATSVNISSRESFLNDLLDRSPATPSS